jgi:D-alanyl-D-alanine carboxypeptidase
VGGQRGTDDDSASSVGAVAAAGIGQGERAPGEPAGPGDPGGHRGVPGIDGAGEVDAAELAARFDGLELPDTAPVTGPPPPVTGDPAADARIRTLAEARGYQRRPTAIGPLVAVDVTLAHPTVAAAFGALRDEAASEGIDLRAVSGFRSTEHQRENFLRELHAPAADVAAGLADAEVDAALAWVAPPGYSKHETGFALDLVEGEGTLADFEGTAAARWLAADGYERPRRHGFVPSYPPGGGRQGPEPEPWEYVHVGVEASRSTVPAA